MSKTITKPRRLPQNLIPNITVKNPLSGIPKLMLTNVMSLTPKIDEVREFIIRNEIDLTLIAETWLRWLPTFVPLGHWYLANPVERENCVGKCEFERFACKFPRKM